MKLIIAAGNIGAGQCFARQHSPSALTARFGVARLGIAFDKFDNLPGNILAGRVFDAFQTGGGVNFHNDRTVVRSQQVDAAHVQPHRLGRADRRAAFFRRDLDELRTAATV